MALLRYLKPEQKKSSLLDLGGPFSEEEKIPPSDLMILEFFIHEMFRSGQRPRLQVSIR